MAELRAGLLGKPLDRSLSPWLFRYFSEITGHRIHYGLRECGPETFAGTAAAAAADGWAGFNATIPVKAALSSIASSRDEAAEISGAANAARFSGAELEARNTDADALSAALASRGTDPAGKSVFIYGAGGAAASSCFVFAGAGAGSITVMSRSEDRAAGLCRRFAEVFPRTVFAPLPSGRTAEASILVNATPVGMYSSGRTPVLPARGDLCVDWAYAPGGTGLVRRALEAGAETVDGLELLTGQAILSLFFWGGCRETDIVELKREALARLRADAGS